MSGGTSRIETVERDFKLALNLDRVFFAARRSFFQTRKSDESISAVEHRAFGDVFTCVLAIFCAEDTSQLVRLKEAHSGYPEHLRQFFLQPEILAEEKEEHGDVYVVAALLSAVAVMDEFAEIPFKLNRALFTVTDRLSEGIALLRQLKMFKSIAEICAELIESINKSESEWPDQDEFRLPLGYQVAVTVLWRAFCDNFDDVWDLKERFDELGSLEFRLWFEMQIRNT